MKKLQIENYSQQLTNVCVTCPKNATCKKHESLCMRKRFVFNIAKFEYRRRVKKGLINECD